MQDIWAVALKKALHVLSRWVLVLSGFAVIGAAAPLEIFGVSIVNVGNVTVKYWLSPRGAPFAEFEFRDKDFVNTYLLNCNANKFLWTRNVVLATGERTDNNSGAEWRSLHSGSTVANAVAAATCPQLLNSLAKAPETQLSAQTQTMKVVSLLTEPAASAPQTTPRTLSPSQPEPQATASQSSTKTTGWFGTSLLLVELGVALCIILAIGVAWIGRKIKKLQKELEEARQLRRLKEEAEEVGLMRYNNQLMQPYFERNQEIKRATSSSPLTG